MTSSFDEQEESEVAGWFWDGDDDELSTSVGMQKGKQGEDVSNGTPTTPTILRKTRADAPIDENSSSSLPRVGNVCFIESLPPQLHPAVSLGMHRASSFYFSVSDELSTSGSMADLLSLLGQGDNDSVCSGANLNPDASFKNNNSSRRKFGRQISSLSVSDPIDQPTAKDTTATRSSSQDVSTADPIDSLTSVTEMTTSKSSLLYHDIMMHVLTYLDAHSLASFSETAKQPNYDTFYFLQLQLQRSLIIASNRNAQATVANNNSKTDETVASDSTSQEEETPTSSIAVTQQNQRMSEGQNQNQPYNEPDNLSAIAGAACVSRLASLNRKEARETVQEYIDSNSSLRTLPLSHSLAYIRHVLRSGGFFHMMQMHRDENNKSTTVIESDGLPNLNMFPNNNHGLGKAALFIAVVGAASVFSGSEVYVPDISEVSNLLFRLGFVGSMTGIMGAARQRMAGNDKDIDSGNEYEPGSNMAPEHDQNPGASTSKMRETAEAMVARTLEELPASMSVPLRRMFEAFQATTGVNIVHSNDSNNTSATSSSCDSGNDADSQTDANTEPIVRQPLATPDPYEHLPNGGSVGSKTSAQSSSSNIPMKKPQQLQQQQSVPKKSPSGCVGAYFRAIHRASTKITEVIKQRRKEKFLQISDAQQVSTTFIDACCSDDSLQVVKNMVQEIDVDKFFVGSDGTETCALHAAAFHGACKVLEFLCHGIDETNPEKDGGLCDVNLRDANGWTACHFAAGANSVDAIRILANHGADLEVEAANGYTPFQWAQRLQHHDVAEEIRTRLMNPQNHHHHHLIGSSAASWISRQRLSAIQHFFSLIPSH